MPCSSVLMNQALFKTTWVPDPLVNPTVQAEVVTDGGANWSTWSSSEVAGGSAVFWPRTFVFFRSLDPSPSDPSVPNPNPNPNPPGGCEIPLQVKQRVPDKDFPDLGLGPEPGQLEKPAG